MKKRSILAYLLAFSLSLGMVHVAFATDGGSAPAVEQPAVAPEPAADGPSAPEAPAEPGPNTGADSPGDGPEEAGKDAAPSTGDGEPAEPAQPPTDLSGLASLFQTILAAVKDGNWPLAASLSLMLLIGGARLARDKWEWGFLAFLDNRWGKWGTLFAGSLAGAVSTALLAGSSLSLSLFMKALVVAFSTAGIHTLWKDATSKD